MNSHESFSSIAAKRRRIAEPERVQTFGEGVLLDMDLLCMNDLYSDVSFFVEDQRISGHCAILATRCKYFHTMLFESMSEWKERQIRLTVPLEAFKVILGYLYSGTLPMSTMDVGAIFQVLGLANLYGLLQLQTFLTEHLLETLSVGNVCTILDTARQFNIADLITKSLNFIDANGAKVIEDDSFQKLSKESLEEVLSRETLIAHELNVFHAVKEWSRHNPDVDIKSVASLLRLPLIKVEDLLGTVRRSGLVDANNIFDVIDKAIKSENLPYRARESPGVDVASVSEWGTRSMLNKNEILIELSFWCFINNIGICISGINNSIQMLDFTVAISCDKTHWVGLGTFKFSAFPPYLDITFMRRPVRFIRILQLTRKNYFKDMVIRASLSPDTTQEMAWETA